MILLDQDRACCQPPGHQYRDHQSSQVYPTRLSVEPDQEPEQDDELWNIDK